MTDPYKQLREALEKATPGPWVSRANGDIGWINESDDQSDGFMIHVAYTDLDNRDANRIYIAAANPQAIAALLAERDALLKVANAVNDAMTNYERMGEVCPFEGQPMIYADTLTELGDLARAALGEKS